MSGKMLWCIHCLKKPGFGLANKNFRPISNLQFTSKVTEKAVAMQLQAHMLTNQLVPGNAWCVSWASLHWDGVNESQEWYSYEYGYGSCDTPSSFGPQRRLWYLKKTVDHDILIHRLQSLLGLRGSALQWFRSYLRGRAQQVTINGVLSKKFGLEYRVPQGSCLSFLLFTFYASKLFSIIKFHLPSAHSYADDTQSYLSFRPLESTCEAEA